MALYTQAISSAHDVAEGATICHFFDQKHLLLCIINLNLSQSQVKDATFSGHHPEATTLRLSAVCSCHTATQPPLFLLSHFFHSLNKISYIGGTVEHAFKYLLLKNWGKQIH